VAGCDLAGYHFSQIAFTQMRPPAFKYFGSSLVTAGRDSCHNQAPNETWVLCGKRKREPPSKRKSSDVQRLSRELRRAQRQQKCAKVAYMCSHVKGVSMARVGRSLPASVERYYDAPRGSDGRGDASPRSAALRGASAQ
jgi:hypothetical protein